MFARPTRVFLLGLLLAMMVQSDRVVAGPHEAAPAGGAPRPHPATSPLSGRWQFDAPGSTDLSPWSALELTITIDGDRVTLRRRFSAGRRTFTETIDLDLAREVNVVPISWWPDNRHLGAYAGGDHTRRIRASRLDGGRILRLSSDLVLEAQQGPREVNILSDYKVSLDGTRLTLTELRSTRTRPVVYDFKRLADQ